MLKLICIHIQSSDRLSLKMVQRATGLATLLSTKMQKHVSELGRHLPDYSLSHCILPLFLKIQQAFHLCGLVKSVTHHQLQGGQYLQVMTKETLQFLHRHQQHMHGKTLNFSWLHISRTFPLDLEVTHVVDLLFQK